MSRINPFVRHGSYKSREEEDSRETDENGCDLQRSSVAGIGDRD